MTAGGTYTYQLRFANSRNVNTGNVVIFDVLESAHGSNPYWQGTLQSINTSQPQMKGIAPVIYYSTYPGFTNLTVDGHQADLTDTTIWSTTAPENLADVTAIAIDLRYKADGTEYVFSPEEIALCYVTMHRNQEQHRNSFGKRKRNDPERESCIKTVAHTSRRLYTWGMSLSVVQIVPQEDYCRYHMSFMLC